MTIKASVARMERSETRSIVSENTPGWRSNMGLDYEIFKLGNVRLQRGGTLPDCKLAYKAFGKISAAKDNVILYPTWYSASITTTNG
jgi:homoserine acetyltransferase